MVGLMVGRGKPSNDEKYDNDNVIENKDYEYFKNNRTEEINKHCDVIKMQAYGLIGDAQTLQDDNEICPKIDENCCGSIDQKQILKYWEKDNKKFFFHNRAMLKTFEYLLGYGKEYKKMALKIVKDWDRRNSSEGEKGKQTKLKTREELNIYAYVQSNKYCRDAADKLLHLDFHDENKAQNIMQ